jgi:hypothetical protein
MITVTDYSLTIEGMKLTMSAANETYVFTNCPKEACQVLKEAGLIEDFTIDKNGEPVILYTDKNEPKGYGYELWCHFVKSFPNVLRVGQMIIDAVIDVNVSKRNRLIVNRMLSPLNKAA